MQPAVLKALEFDRIRDELADRACTPLGRARLLALEPAADPALVRRRLALAVEAAAFVGEGGSLALSAPEDLLDSLAVLAIEDQPLAPGALVGLARFSASVDEVVLGIRRSNAAERSSSRLEEIARRAASFAAEADAIDRAISPSGDVTDQASPALRELRDALRRRRANLRTTLEGLARGRESAKYLQEHIITDRNGRYVLVVRAEHRGAVPGIVHGSSASGASVYLEPLATVEMNNEIVALAEREAIEIRRILLALTDAFRLRAGEFDAMLEAAADLDELHAKTDLALRMDGRAPLLATDGGVEFLGARHPLLVLAFRERAARDRTAAEPTAVDLVIAPPIRALVISGPNTGGKTVALKAAGLLALMAQAGMLVPVERGSRFTPFRTVFADIGDEQSISASLSTFSARVANLVSMDRDLDLPALVLLDEVGSGTDPAEGAALGTAVINHFRRRGAIVLATTHDEALKTYAATTDGVRAAAFGFDPDTYAPTYRLVYGAPGRSLALEIAERLGMPASVIADARALRSGRESRLADHLARVDRELAALEKERAGLDAERARLAGERKEILDREARTTEREAVLKKRLDDRVNEKLREARAEIDRILGRLKEQAGGLAERRGRPLSTGEIGRLGVEGRTALDAVGAGFGLDAPAAVSAEELTSAPAVGDTVFVASLGAAGLVRGVSGAKIDVEIRGKRVRVPLDALRRAVEPSRGDVSSAGRGRATSAAMTNHGAPRASSELVVIGSTVEEALDRVEKFLDDALLADERRLRIVHGHGTGRLRDALRTFFRGHPLVASVAPAPENEGGQGATVVMLKE
jgi:DNA mismatch repair protein MutS2